LATVDTGYGSVSTYYSWTGDNFENQVASPITMPSPGKITEIWIHGGGYGLTAYTYHCVWEVAGALVGRSGTINWEDGRRWEGATGLSISVAKKSYWLGFYCSPTYERQWSEAGNGSGTQYRKTTTSGVVGMDSSTEHNAENAICAYAIYSPTGMKVWNGSSWVQGTVKVWNGSSWVDAKSVKVWNGSSWVDSL
jgi:hypothetical protein